MLTGRRNTIGYRMCAFLGGAGSIKSYISFSCGFQQDRPQNGPTYRAEAHTARWPKSCLGIVLQPTGGNDRVSKCSQAGLAGGVVPQYDVV